MAAARFRPNLVIDAAHDPEPGQELRLGDVGLRVIVPTPRCVVPGLGQGQLPADRSLLSALAKHHRVLVPGFGRAACFGTYAEVLQPGRIRLGQRVH
ncbi:MOSC domain-containing protein [Micromonospora sp. DR5-3]|uniref:MOSC domain-containing protein n=1 Tax=Micromonospora sp. DR5-3 TaxID=2992129 RepID=UPI0039B6FD0A